MVDNISALVQHHGEGSMDVQSQENSDKTRYLTNNPHQASNILKEAAKLGNCGVMIEILTLDFKPTTTGITLLGL